MEAINKESTLQRLKSYRKHPLSAILFLLVVISAVITLTVLIALIAYILIKGIPNLSPELFEWEYTTENVSMMPAIINALIITALSLLFALPVGICSAIYLVEYAKRRNKRWFLLCVSPQKHCPVFLPLYMVCLVICSSISSWMELYHSGWCTDIGNHDFASDHAYNRRSPHCGT